MLFATIIELSRADVDPNDCNASRYNPCWKVSSTQQPKSNSKLGTLLALSFVIASFVTYHMQEPTSGIKPMSRCFETYAF
jgi:hypothetical protein